MDAGLYGRGERAFFGGGQEVKSVDFRAGKSLFGICDFMVSKQVKNVVENLINMLF